MLSIPQNCYLVVFMPCDPEEYMGYEPKAWVVDSYSMAIESIQEFLSCGDFIPEIDCRFEIFDDHLNPSGQQEMLQDMILSAMIVLEEVGPQKGSASTGAPVSKAILPEAPKTPEVKFNDVQIEDNR